MENTTVLVPLMLLGWIPISVLAFLLMRPRHAILFIVLGGVLFLPMAGYNLPGFPEYDKKVAIAVGLVIGSILSGYKYDDSFQWKMLDLAMLVWCLCPIATSLFNHLGLYDGLSATIKNIATFSVPYFIGRMYFTSPRTLKEICIAFMIGGLIYVPFCIYEIRMSPQLHTLVYGFFQHSFDQHIRYGGFRPIVFMQHGLMVSLWMALSTVVTFWYWRHSEDKHLLGIPLLFVLITLAATAILCKSANGWAMLVLGTGCCLLYQSFGKVRLFQLFIWSIPVYFFIRISGLITSVEVVNLASLVFDEDRIASLAYRLNQEDLICVEVLKRPFLGWGRFGRGLPVDPETGEVLIFVRDSLWLITFQTYGFVGLCSLYISLLGGPFLVLNKSKELVKSGSNFYVTLAIAFSLVVIFFCVDTLFNSMINPMYLLVSGALVSISDGLSNHEDTVEIPIDRKG